MKRYAMTRLEAWKTNPRRKPLVIHGARQVGKTWLMKEFGRTHYTKTVYLNFEHNDSLKKLFDGDFGIPRLINGLQVESGTIITPEDTLILFDEVQEVPAALTALKYFCENASEYQVIAAGPLLGLTVHPGTSFPVGKVDFLNLYPLHFREFLDACGMEELCAMLGTADTDMMNVFSSRFIQQLKTYYFTGGMPEAVQTWLDTGDCEAVREVQKNLEIYYQSDFSKHAPEMTVRRILQVWNGIPAQLAKENRRFVFGQIREGARAKDFELALQWMHDAGLVYLVPRVSKPGLPLSAYAKPSQFKLFMLDVGLMAAMSGLDRRTLLAGNRFFEEFKGALTEQYVLQQLIADSGLQAYYFSEERSDGEIDFLVQAGGHLLPVEVKAAENLQAKSLRAFHAKYGPALSVRTSLSPYREQKWMVNVPLYDIGAWFAGRRRAATA